MRSMRNSVLFLTKDGASGSSITWRAATSRSLPPGPRWLAASGTPPGVAGGREDAAATASRPFVDARTTAAGRRHRRSSPRSRRRFQRRAIFRVAALVSAVWRVRFADRRDRPGTGSRAPLRARPVCGVVDLRVIQAHRGRPPLHGSPSPGRVSRPPLSRAALGRPQVPCFLIKGGYFGVHVLADGDRGPPDDPPDHAWRDA